MIRATLVPRTFRIAILLLAILATLGVSAASVSSGHIHESSPGTSCDVCFTAHTVTYQAAQIIQPPVAPQQLSFLHAAARVIAGYQLFLEEASLTRGPPVHSL